MKKVKSIGTFTKKVSKPLTQSVLPSTHEDVYAQLTRLGLTVETVNLSDLAEKQEGSILLESELRAHLKSLQGEVSPTKAWTNFLQTRVGSGDEYAKCDLLADIKALVANAGKECVAFEESMVKHVGPQGGHPVISEWLPSLAEYYTQPTGIQDSASIQLEAAALRLGIIFQKGLPMEGYSRSYLKRLSLEEAYLHTQLRATKETNAGFPLWCKKSEAPARQRAIRGVSLTRGIAVVGTRRQRNKYLPRNIFMTDIAEVNSSARYLIPLMEMFQKSPLSYFRAFSMWNGPLAVGEAYSSYLAANPTGVDYTLESDFKAMDKSVVKRHAELVFKVLSPLFPSEDHEDLLREMTGHFNDALLVTPEYLVTGEHATFSGVAWTQLIETILLAIIDEAFSSTLLVRPSNGSRMTLITAHPRFKVFIGDDSAMVYRLPYSDPIFTREGEVGTLAYLFSKFALQCGLIAEPAKQFEHSGFYFTFCKRLYLSTNQKINPDTGNLMVAPVYPITLALNSIKYPERLGRDWSSAKDLARTAQILDGCVHHKSYVQLMSNFIPQHVVVSEDLLSEVFALPVGNFVTELYDNPDWVPEKSPTLALLKGRLDPKPTDAPLSEGMVASFDLLQSVYPDISFNGMKNIFKRARRIVTTWYSTVKTLGAFGPHYELFKYNETYLAAIKCFDSYDSLIVQRFYLASLICDRSESVALGLELQDLGLDLLACLAEPTRVQLN